MFLTKYLLPGSRQQCFLVTRVQPRRAEQPDSPQLLGRHLVLMVLFDAAGFILFGCFSLATDYAVLLVQLVLFPAAGISL